MKNNNYIKYTLITFAIVFSIFFKVDNVFADSCYDTKFSCWYSANSSNGGTTIMIDVDLKTQRVKVDTEYIEGFNAEYEQNYKINDFFESGVYKCPSSITYTYNSKSNHFNFEIGGTNSATFESGCSEGVKFGEEEQKAIERLECGYYYNSDTKDAHLGVNKINGEWDLIFYYIDDYNNERSLPFSAVADDIFTKGYDSNGCPVEACFGYSLWGSQVKYSSSQNYACHKKQGKEKPEVNKQKDKITGWDKVKAQLFGANDITDGTIECEDTLGDALGVLQKVFTAIKVCSVILTIILIMLDFIKTITSDDGDLKKVSKASVKRLVILVVIIILPSLINFIIETIAIGNGTCSIR